MEDELEIMLKCLYPWEVCLNSLLCDMKPDYHNFPKSWFHSWKTSGHQTQGNLLMEDGTKNVAI